MITFAFKRLKFGDGRVLDYKSQMMEIVTKVPPVDEQGVSQRGFTREQSRTATALSDRVKAANGSVELTPEEAVDLWRKVQTIQWPFADNAFAEFTDDIEALVKE